MFLKITAQFIILGFILYIATKISPFKQSFNKLIHDVEIIVYEIILNLLNIYLFSKYSQHTKLYEESFVHFFLLFFDHFIKIYPRIQII